MFCHKYFKNNKTSKATLCGYKRCSIRALALNVFNFLYHKLCIVLFFLFVWSLYLYYAAPSVFWGDGGDLILSSWFLGVPHPTGYPLFILLGKFFQVVPVGDIAFRTTMALSILPITLAIAIFFFMSLETLQSFWLSLYFVMLFIIFSPLVWKQALVSEVYGLNLFFVLFLIYLVLKKKHKEKDSKNTLETNKQDACSNNTLSSADQNYNLSLSTFFFIVLVSMIGLGNHGTLLFTVIVILIIYSGKYLLNRKKFFNLSSVSFLIFTLLIFMIGLSQYIALPIFSAREPLFNWNIAEKFYNFYLLISGKEFGFISGYKDIVKNFYSVFEVLFNRLSIFGLIIFILGIFTNVISVSQRVMLLLIFIFNVVFASFYITKEQEAFSLVSYFVFMLFCIIAIKYLMSTFVLKLRILPLVNILAGMLFVLFCAYHLFAEITNPKHTHAKEEYFNIRENFSPAIHSLSILTYLPKNTLLFIDNENGDPLLSLLYYQYIKGIRKDIFIFHRMYTIFPWYLDYMKQKSDTQGYSFVLPDISNLQNKLFAFRAEDIKRLPPETFHLLAKVNILSKEIIEKNESKIPVCINQISNLISSELLNIQTKKRGSFFELSIKK